MTPDAIVYIVDDDQAMRSSLRLVMIAAGLRVRVYESAQAFLAEFDPQAAGCLVLDLKMPGVSGFDLQQTMKRRGEQVPILFLTGHGEVSAAVHAMKMGAVDFLEKPVDHHLLIERVRQALETNARVRQRRAEKEPSIHAMRTLTAREVQVLDLLMKGLGNKQIASQLHRSIRTVENHRARILRKFEARSSTQLVQKVLAAAEDAVATK